MSDNNKGGLMDWINDRLPIYRAWDTHMAKYYAPKNFNFWYFFGVLSLFVLVNQLLTGIWLTMHYTPSAEDDFASVEYIMRDVDYGWLLRYMHSTGASAFFIVVYLHMFRGLLYGSYKAPRELVWVFGMFIFLMLMAEAFMGYVLPWGQMSYWGAQVIVSLFGAIPVVGDDLVQWIRGDFLISGATLNRFFSLHVVALPIVILALVLMHVLALHEVGSNNPDGVEIKKNKDENGIPKDGIPFHPFYTVHDLVGVTVFLFVFCFIIFFMPEAGGYFLEYANFEEANNLKTPTHIAPVWYFTPFYAVLRAITIDLGPISSKLLGFIMFAASVAILFVLPWVDKSPVKSIRYKGFMPRVSLMLFAAIFVILGYLGVKSPTEGRTVLGQLATVYYFAFFFQMPMVTNPLKKQTTVWNIAMSLFFGLMLLNIAWIGFGHGEDHVGMFLHLFGTALAAFVIATPWLVGKDSVLPEPDRTQEKGLPKSLVWGGFLLFVLLTIVPIKAVASAGGFNCGAIQCDAMEPDLTNKESLQSGAKWFTNYCMGCHSAKYSRYGRVADDLDIPHDVMLSNLVFDDVKIGSLMNIPMQKDQSKAWFGATPPDLTLVARSRNPEWLYTYLRNFYKDDSRPTGVNNRVFDKVAMPHVMLEMQGLQECAPGPKLNSHGNAVRDDLGDVVMDEHCGSLQVGDVKGTVSPEEFDEAVYDLVNFMAYVAEPMTEERKSLGVYVLLFLCVLFVFTYLLNREYWRDIH